MRLQDYERKRVEIERMGEKFNAEKELYIAEKVKNLDWGDFINYLGEVSQNAFDVKVNPIFGGESKYRDNVFVGFFCAFGDVVVNNTPHNREILGARLVEFIKSRIEMEFDFEHDIEDFAE